MLKAHLRRACRRPQIVSHLTRRHAHPLFNLKRASAKWVSLIWGKGVDPMLTNADRGSGQCWRPNFFCRQVPTEQIFSIFLDFCLKFRRCRLLTVLTYDPNRVLWKSPIAAWDITDNWNRGSLKIQKQTANWTREPVNKSRAAEQGGGGTEQNSRWARSKARQNEIRLVALVRRAQATIEDDRLLTLLDCKIKAR